MLKKRLFRRKLFLYLFPVFILFTLAVMLYQYNREREFKRLQLEQTLDDITELTHRYIASVVMKNADDYQLIDSLMRIVPQQGVRITVVSSVGDVLYDSQVDTLERMENHLMRPEVQLSVSKGYGAQIRKSVTTGQSYYYYARYYQDYFIRTAIVYDLDLVKFLQAERYFIVVLLVLFLFLWAVLAFITNRLGQTITQLKDYALMRQQGNDEMAKVEFPDDELGVIGRQIVNVYDELNEAKELVQREREKLYDHLSALNIGVAFFTAQRKQILANSHFVEYLNQLSDQVALSARAFFTFPEAHEVTSFLDRQRQQSGGGHGSVDSMEQTLYRNGRYFSLKCVLFHDASFEIVLMDVTRLEKRRVLKQQMTSNIAHELKTPVASVMGYLETLKSSEMSEEKRQYFIGKAYSQAVRLGDLINDIAVLNKIEEGQQHFVFEQVNIGDLLDELCSGMQGILEAAGAIFSSTIKEGVVMKGNRTLLYSVFHNLLENAVKYGGEGIHIHVSMYNEDERYYYFKFSDNGEGIPEEHLVRIFERFYRVDHGRSRKTGGTGLGLAIVKNAVRLHGGEISARNGKNGGCEFLFSLAKNCQER